MRFSLENENGTHFPKEGVPCFAVSRHVSSRSRRQKQYTSNSTHVNRLRLPASQRRWWLGATLYHAPIQSRLLNGKIAPALNLVGLRGSRLAAPGRRGRRKSGRGGANLRETSRSPRKQKWPVSQPAILVVFPDLWKEPSGIYTTRDCLSSVTSRLLLRGKSLWQPTPCPCSERDSG